MISGQIADVASGPDGVLVVELKACTSELRESIQYTWSESYRIGSA